MKTRPLLDCCNQGLGAVSLDGKLVDIASIKQADKLPKERCCFTLLACFSVSIWCLIGFPQSQSKPKNRGNHRPQAEAIVKKSEAIAAM